MDHPDCKGHWVCETPQKAIPGTCMWDCDQTCTPDDYCDSASDCDPNLKPMDCDGYFSCIEHRCYWRCNSGNGFCQDASDCANVPHSECMQGHFDCDNGVCSYKCEQDVTDYDHDGVDDADDPCPFDIENDVDQDGVCGNIDNCPSVPNPDQADADHDGFGDACGNPADTGVEAENGDYAVDITVHTAGLRFDYLNTSVGSMIQPHVDEYTGDVSVSYGAPQLLVKSFYVQLPMDCASPGIKTDNGTGPAVALTVADGDLTVFNNVKVFPRQNPLHEGMDYNDAFYDGVLCTVPPCPQPGIPMTAWIDGETRVGDWHLVKVTVRPFGIQNNRLNLAKTVRFTVQCTRDQDPAADASHNVKVWPRVFPQINEFLESMVVNNSAPYKHPNYGKMVSALGTNGPEFLIIGPKDLQSPVNQYFVNKLPAVYNGNYPFAWPPTYVTTEDLRNKFSLNQQGITSFPEYIKSRLIYHFNKSNLAYVMLVGDVFDIPLYRTPGIGLFGTDYATNTAVRIYGWMKWDWNNPHYVFDCSGWCRVTLGSNPDDNTFVRPGGQVVTTTLDWESGRIGSVHGLANRPFGTCAPNAPHCAALGPRGEFNASPVVVGYNQVQNPVLWVPFEVDMVQLHGEPSVSAAHLASVDLSVQRGTGTYVSHAGTTYAYQDIPAADVSDTANAGQTGQYKFQYKWLDKFMQDLDGKDLSDLSVIVGWIVKYTYTFQNLPPANPISPNGLPLRWYVGRAGDYEYTRLSPNSDFPMIALSRIPVYGPLDQRKAQLRNAFSKIIAYEKGESVQWDAASKTLTQSNPPDYSRLVTRVLLSGEGFDPPHAPVSHLEDIRRTWFAPVNSFWKGSPDFLYDYEWYGTNNLHGIDPGNHETRWSHDTLMKMLVTGDSVATTDIYDGTSLKPGVGYIIATSHMNAYCFGGCGNVSNATFSTAFVDMDFTTPPSGCTQPVYPIASFGGCEPANIDVAHWQNRTTMVASALLNSPCRGVSQFAGSLTREAWIGDPVLHRYMDLLKTNNALNIFLDNQGHAVGGYSHASSAYLWDLAVWTEGHYCYEGNCNNEKSEQWKWMVYGDPVMQPRFPADADGDGLPDSTDSCPDIAGAQADWDKDGVGDDCDVCPGKYNPDQKIAVVNGKWAHTQGRACAQGNVTGSAVIRYPSPYDAYCDASDPDCMAWWDNEQFGIALKPDMVLNSCDLSMGLPLSHDDWYRVEVFYSFTGYAGPQCGIEIKNGDSFLDQRAIDEVSYGVSHGDGTTRKGVALIKAVNNNELCIRATTPESCPVVVVKKVVVIPDTYVFTHDDNEENWEGPEQTISSITGGKKWANGFAVGGKLAVVEGPMAKDQFFIRQTASGGHVLSKAYPAPPAGCGIAKDDKKGDTVYHVQCNGNTSEVDQADTFAKTCPVSVDVALRANRKYLVIVPYFVDTQPWYNGEPMSMLGQTGTGDMYSRQVCLEKTSGPDECWPLNPLNSGYPRDMEHWNRLRKLQYGYIILNPTEDAGLLKFCQQGFGRYLVDNVMVMDLGPAD